MRKDLILRHGEARVPRYTSYPTAPQFNASVSEESYRDWLAGVPAGAPVSLYLHVPFCRSMCWYCGCHTKVAARDAPVAAYIDRLLHEIDLVARALPHGVRVERLHWGGGTPTIVGPASFIRMAAYLRRRLNLTRDAEIAIEADPRRLSPDMVDALAGAGVTRVSLGVQTLDPTVQAAINRVVDFGTVLRATELLRRAGITALNIDLMYGLPRQSVVSCADTADLVTALQPDRVAVFGYAHVPWLKSHQRMIQETALPDAAERLDQFAATAERLESAGYEQIGLDHFARPADGLLKALRERRLRRNFQGYTDDSCEHLIGLGASAIGAFPEGYVQNTPSLNEYARHIDAGRLPTARGRRLTRQDMMRRDVIEQIMCYQQVDLAAVAKRYGFGDDIFAPEREALAAFVAEGIVTLEGSVLTLQPDCRLLMRNVAAVFDAYLQPQAQRHSRAV